LSGTQGGAPGEPTTSELTEAARQLEVSGLAATRDTSRQVLTVGAAILAVAAGAARAVSASTTSFERDALGVAAVALGASVAAGATTLFFLTWETTRRIPVASGDRAGARATSVRVALGVQLGSFALAVVLATMAVVASLGHPR
jgi:hypothetical protein